MVVVLGPVLGVEHLHLDPETTGHCRPSMGPLLPARMLIHPVCVPQKFVSLTPVAECLRPESGTFVQVVGVTGLQCCHVFSNMCPIRRN